jgi:hypothetical protein
MPFSGFPVFRFSRTATLVLNRRSSLRLPRLLRVLTRSLPAVPCETLDSARTEPDHTRSPATLLNVACSSALVAERFLSGGVAKSHRSPLVAFLRLQRAVPQGATLSTQPGLFHPDNALELSPSGLLAVRRYGLISETKPPLPFGAALRRRVRLRRIDPSAKRPQLRCHAKGPCPPGVLPFEALPSTALVPASRLLLSRASRTARPKTCKTLAPQSVNQRWTWFLSRCHV